MYALAKAQSNEQRTARRLVNELMDRDRLRVSTQVLQELFVTLTRKAAQRCTPAEAVKVLEDLTAWPLVVVDYAAIRAAGDLADRASLSFRDALIVVGAALSGAATLLTEDLTTGQKMLGCTGGEPVRGVRG